jgi:hypothetical protein
MKAGRRLMIRAFQGLALITAGIMAAIGVGWYAEHVRDPWMPSERWLGWMFTTVLLAYLVWRDCRLVWRRVPVFTTLAGLFVGHTLGYAVLFRYAPVWRPVWYVLLMLFEYRVFLFVLQRVDSQVGDVGDHHTDST